MNTSDSCLIKQAIALFEKIPYSLLAFIARFSIAAVFWKSGQTKVEGLAIDLINGTFELGTPKLAASTLPLFRSNTTCHCCRRKSPRTWRRLPSTFSRC